MADFLTTTGIAYHIENIIVSAKKELILVTPYLKLSRILFERLIDANNRGVKINIIYGKTELGKSQRSDLDKLENINLYFLKNLHAKCYYNEEILIIGSMNLYEFSEKNNREMGVLISKNHESVLYKQVQCEMESIRNASKIIKESIPAKKEEGDKPIQQDAFDIYAKYLRGQYPNDTFKINRKIEDGEILYSEVISENFLKSGISICISHRIEFEFCMPKHWVRNIYNNLNLRNIDNDYRIYWDSPDYKMTVYNGVQYKENWDEISELAKIEYFNRALITIVNEAKHIIK